MFANMSETTPARIADKVRAAPRRSARQEECAQPKSMRNPRSARPSLCTTKGWAQPACYIYIYIYVYIILIYLIRVFMYVNIYKHVLRTRTCLRTCLKQLQREPPTRCAPRRGAQHAKRSLRSPRVCATQEVRDQTCAQPKVGRNQHVTYVYIYIFT